MRLRAWPWHCDAYRHLNSASYLRLAEYARWAWGARTPWLKRAMSDGWVGLVGGVDVVYRRPIPLMSAFEVVCRVTGADERWLFISYEFVLPNGQIACRALARLQFRSRKGIVAPEEAARVAGIPIPEKSSEIDLVRVLAESQLATIGR